MSVLVFEAPLLLEAGWRDLVDQVWLVRAPLDAARARLQQRNGLSAGEAATRIAAQAPIDPAQADVVIDNDGDLAALGRRVEAAWLTQRARGLV